MQSQAPESSVQNRLFVHFGLRENPFAGTPNPRFLYHSETHREALASLINGIHCEFGFQVLVAQPGMGKTTLLFDFLEGFRDSARTAFLFQPQLEPHELLQSLLSELGAGSEDTSVRKLSEQINHLLGHAAEERKRVIVVVDEAQNLDFAVLETLRQLSNFETARAKLMQIVLAGQPQLAKKLAAPEQEQLRQRISTFSRLSPLTLNETRAYINHRLRTAGYRGSDLFTMGAGLDIWEHSKGIPRNINTLCFNAMLLAFAGNAKSIDESVLEEAARDLDMTSVLADVYRTGPSLVPPRNSSREFQPIRNANPLESESVRLGNRGSTHTSVSQKTEVGHTAVATNGGNNGSAGQNIPLALVEAIVRISQTLEEQKILLAAKSVTSTEGPPPIASTSPANASAPAASLGTIPTVAGKKPPASVEVAHSAPSVPATRTTVSLRSESAASAEKTTAPKPEKVARSGENPATGTAAAQPKNIAAAASFLSQPPTGRSDNRAARKRSGIGGFWPKAIALIGVTTILSFVVVEKSPWQNQAQANAPEPSSSVPGQGDSASGYSVPAGSPASPMDTPIRTSKQTTTTSRASRNFGSDGFDDVTVRKFPAEPAIAPGASAPAKDSESIFFDQNSAEISGPHRAALQQIAAALAKDPEASAILEGHTDNTGPEAYNLELSSRRAIAVREALINEFNVPSTQLTAIGSGSAAPVHPNSSAEGRAYNRRVAVRLVRLGD